MSTQQTVEALKSQHRERRYWMKLQQKIDRAMESYVRRTHTDWAAAESEADREKENKKALALIAAARKSEGSAKLIMTVKRTDESRKPADTGRAECEREMERIAEALKVHAWVETVRGFGTLGLASIIGEAGAPLEKFPTPSHLWSRLGYAPFGRDGEPRYAGSSWKRDTWHSGSKALSAEEWTDHPFSGERYAIIFAIGDSMFRAQIEGKAKSGTKFGKAKGPYGEAYVARRERLELTHPDWTPGHKHKDALRIMVKTLLRDLWVEWQRAERPGWVNKPWREAAE